MFPYSGQNSRYASDEAPSKYEYLHFLYSSGCYGTHAYCINSSAAEVLLRRLPEISGYVGCEISLLARRFPQEIHLRRSHECLFHKEGAKSSISWFWNVPAFQLAGKWLFGFIFTPVNHDKRFMYCKTIQKLKGLN